MTAGAAFLLAVIPLFVGMMLVHLLNSRVQDQLDLIEHRRSRSLTELDNIEKDFNGTLEDVHKLPSRLKATRQYILGELDKAASKPKK